MTDFQPYRKAVATSVPSSKFLNNTSSRETGVNFKDFASAV